MQLLNTTCSQCILETANIISAQPFNAMTAASLTLGKQSRRLLCATHKTFTTAQALRGQTTSNYSAIPKYLISGGMGCSPSQVLDSVKVVKEMDRETLINVSRTSLRTKVGPKVADILTEVSAGGSGGVGEGGGGRG